MTHRCHNRAFLLKFARDREAYRAKMREHLAEIMGIQPLILSRRETEIIAEAPDWWVLNETKIPYRTEIDRETESQASGTGVI